MLSCSDDDSATISEEERFNQTKALIELNLLPTIENYFARDNGTTTYRSASLAGTWKHEYDREGRLRRSLMYEIFPSRLLKKIAFSEYANNNLQMKIEVSTYTYYSIFPKLEKKHWNLVLNEDFTPNSIIWKEGNIIENFEELNSNKWVTKLGKRIYDGTLIWTTNYEYDEKGNVVKYNTTYPDDEIIDANVDYTYTDWGDLLSYHFENSHGDFSKADYFYRSDNTLERLEESFDYRIKPAGENIYLYDENEALLKQTSNYDDGSRIIIDYNHDAGYIISTSYSENENISEIFNYLALPEEQRYFLSSFEKYLNGILGSIEFYNSDYVKEKKEFYNETGILIYTEYYDEEGNITDTVYP